MGGTKLGTAREIGDAPVFGQAHLIRGRCATRMTRPGAFADATVGQ